MGKLDQKIEKQFEKVSETGTQILANSIVFIVVLSIVAIWVIMVLTNGENLTDKIRDCFIAVSFLSFFLVQRTLNKYNRALHVKINELVKVDDKASDELINVEKKTHKEIDDLAKELHKQY